MNVPGFVDLQVNGYGGADFSDPGLTVDQVLAAATALAARGTVAFCPTVITSSPDTYRKVLPVLAEAAGERQGRGILGIHLEGPFISSREGAVGAHAAAHVQAPDTALFDELWRLSGRRVSLLTLAPEVPGAVALIRHARRLGVAVALGHTLCGPCDVAEAVACGASLSTHLGNACPNLLDRHHKPIWAQLDSPLDAMLITDGHHLPPAVIRTIMRAKGTGHVILTSDSAAVAGLPPGDYRCAGRPVRVTATGRVDNLLAPTLAGSSATMLDCVNHLASLGFADEALLTRVACDNPLAAIGSTRAALNGLTGASVCWREGKFHLEGDY